MIMGALDILNADCFSMWRIVTDLAAVYKLRYLITYMIS